MGAAPYRALCPLPGLPHTLQALELCHPPPAPGGRARLQASGCSELGLRSSRLWPNALGWPCSLGLGSGSQQVCVLHEPKMTVVRKKITLYDTIPALIPFLRRGEDTKKYIYVYVHKYLNFKYLEMLKSSF